MNKSLQQVAEFHSTFEHPIADSPEAQESLKIRQLRIKLLFEELAELAEAGDVKRTMGLLCDEYSMKLLENHGGTEMSIEEAKDALNEMYDSREILDGNKVDKVEELDALCDIQYVLNGKILTAGLQTTFDANFDRVHANNMTKAHNSVEHAKETINKLNGFPEDYSLLNSGDGKFRLLNRFGKLIKPHDHVKVALDLNLR